LNRTWVIVGLMLCLTVAWSTAGASTDSELIEPTLKRAGVAWSFNAHREGRWTNLHSLVLNPTDQGQNLLVVTILDADGKLQFCHSAFVPPHSARTVIQPVKTRSLSRTDRIQGRNFTIRLITPSASGDHLYGKEESSAMMIEFRDALTVLMNDYGDDDEAAAEMSLIQSEPPKAVSMEKDKSTGDRPSGNAHRRVSARQAPMFVGEYDSFETIVICRDEPDLNSAQIEAIRQWVSAGGTLWLMIEQVDNQFCSRLLGDDWTVSPVDQVEINSGTLHGYRGAAASFDLEQPVKMLRTVAEDWEVLATLNDWPAGLRREVGQGQVVLTTVGPRAWIDDRGVANETLQELDRVVYRHRKTAPFKESVFTETSKSLVGHKIMGREMVGFALTAAVVLLLVTGLFFARSNRMGTHALAAVGLSVVMAGVIQLLGASHHHAVPTIVASAELIRVDPTQSQAHVQGSFTLHASETRPLVPSTTSGGLINIQFAEETRILSRMIWTDADKWHWELPPLQPGIIRHAQFEQAYRLKNPTRARMRFKPDQLEVTLDAGDFGGLEDMVLAAPGGHMIPKPMGEGRFQFDTSQHLAKDQYFAGTMSITDTQLQRQEILRSVFKGSDSMTHLRFPDEPTLLGWTRQFDSGVNFIDDAKISQQVLVAVPVEMIRATPGDVITVPPTLITFESDRGPNNKYRMTIYDSRLDQWIQMKTTTMTFMMRFVLPDAVVPLNPTRATLTIDIDAPSRNLTLLDPNADGEKVLDERNEPQGSTSFDLAKWPQFKPDSSGGIVIRLKVSDMLKTATRDAFWSIKGMRLEVTGEVQERTVAMRKREEIHE